MAHNVDVFMFFFKSMCAGPTVGPTTRGPHFSPSHSPSQAPSLLLVSSLSSFYTNPSHASFECCCCFISVCWAPTTRGPHLSISLTISSSHSILVSSLSSFHTNPSHASFECCCCSCCCCCCCFISVCWTPTTRGPHFSQVRILY